MTALEATTVDGWHVVVGLEVHVELQTTTKLFCGCPNAFGDEPNTNVCPVCLGLPGSLPVLNAKAVEYAVRLGRALRCEVRPSVFARKNYFYPDMPKDYQISQYDLPICVDGELELPDGTRVGIERVHMEEDTGKITHVGGGGRIHGAEAGLVDYNRAGVPLVEIVSRPDLRSAEQARQYVQELRAILLAIDVSDARMEEGSLRVDANVSVRPRADAPYGTRCEIKNLNSLRSLGRAIEHEARRQGDVIASGAAVEQETRHWDEEAGRTRAGRSKEEAHDYRYFPDPDLVPLAPSEELVRNIGASLGPLPAERRARLAEAAGVAPADVALLVERGHDEVVAAALGAGADPAKVLTRVENELADGLGRVDGAALAAVVTMEAEGRLTATQAKEVLAAVAETGRDPEEVATERGFEAMDTGELEALVDRLIAAHPDDWADFVGGNDKVQGFFVGQVMRETRGQADGRAVAELLARKRAQRS